MNKTLKSQAHPLAREAHAAARQRKNRERAQVTVHLSELLGRHRIKQTDLAKAGGLRLATVNALYHNKTDTISKLVLARVLTGLRELTGEEYTVADLICFAPLPVNAARTPGSKEADRRPQAREP